MCLWELSVPEATFGPPPNGRYKYFNARFFMLPFRLGYVVENLAKLFRYFEEKWRLPPSMVFYNRSVGARHFFGAPPPSCRLRNANFLKFWKTLKLGPKFKHIFSLRNLVAMLPQIFRKIPLLDFLQGWDKDLSPPEHFCRLRNAFT